MLKKKRAAAQKFNHRGQPVKDSLLLSPEAPTMVVVVILVMMVKRVFSVDHALDVSKLLDMAGNGDCPLLLKPVFLFGFLQQLHEERVIEVYHWDYESLLLLALPHLDGQTPLWNIPVLLFPMVVKVREMQMEVQKTLFSATHL